MLEVQMIGYLGRDAEVIETNGKKIAVFSVCHSNSYLKADGTRHEESIWVSCFKNNPEKIIPYLVKGKQVFVRGQLSLNVKKSNGKEYVNINCNVTTLTLIGGNSNNSEKPSNESPDNQVDENEELPY